MAERLSDERLEIIKVRLLSGTIPRKEEAQTMVDELIARRAALANETPTTVQETTSAGRGQLIEEAWITANRDC